MTIEQKNEVLHIIKSEDYINDAVQKVCKYMDEQIINAIKSIDNIGELLSAVDLEITPKEKK